QVNLCHSSCLLLDAGTMDSFLAKVKTWLDGNPNEVVTIFLENYDKFTPTALSQPFINTGLNKYASSQPAGRAWPTIQSMIDAGTRLVVILDDQAGGTPVPW